MHKQQPILILGCNGQVGWELVRQAEAKSLPFVAYDYADLDLTQHEKVQQKITEFNPCLVMNAAAYTAVDKAETEVELAYAINAHAVENLAKICHGLNIALFHISTDYVFDGQKNQPYVETDATKPINIYGASKLAGEKAIQKHMQNYLILRTSWVFGVHGNNFVKTMLKLGQEKDSLSIVADQIGCPTFAADIAKVLLHCAENWQAEKSGLYHYSGSEQMSWFDFAEKIFQAAKQQGIKTPDSLTKMATQDYPTAAERPLYSVMDCSKFFAVHTIKSTSSINDAITQVLQQALCQKVSSTSINSI